MHFTTGDSTRSWKPVVTADTTDLHYWLHWRVLGSALPVLAGIAVAAYLIWKHEGPGPERRPGGRGNGGGGEARPGLLYDDEAWRPCLRDIHPAWLLAYRLVSFFVLLVLFVVIVIVDRGDIFYYYTQWTFILVTIYFGLSSLLSIYGCSKLGEESVVPTRPDMERGTYRAHRAEGSADMDSSKSGFHEGQREIAGFWGYLLQIIYQTNAGAVMLTDCVFWFIIFPFLTIKDYNRGFLLIGMHSVNAIFLLGEVALNSLRFPWFRIAYFFLWTATFVIFQWLVHISIQIWWPYPFLDLSNSLAPLWYFAILFMHLPCYTLFYLVIKLKHHLLLKWFPSSQLCVN